MKTLWLIPILLLSGCMAQADESLGPDPAPDRLAAALADRVPAGDPIACVRQRDLRGNTIIDEGTILFDGPGDMVYLNRTRSVCAGMRPWHALRFRTVGTQMCEGELIVAFDPASGMEYGGCTLGRFQPYRRRD